MEHALNILLVDDDLGDAFLVEDILGEATRCVFDVDTVTSYKAAITQIRKKTYDAILLDNKLGSHTGIDLLRAEKVALNLVPVIILTGASPESTDKEALAAGASDLVTKKEAIEVSGLLERAILYAIERCQQRKKLSESEERYALAVAGSTDGIWDLDLETKAFYGSNRFKEIIGLPPSKTITFDEWKNQILAEDLPSFEVALQDHLAKKTQVLLHEHRVLTQGLPKWVRVRGIATCKKEGPPNRIAGSLTDIHSEKISQEQILHAATHDNLTDIYNRSFLQTQIDRHLAIANNNPAHTFSIIYVDLDRFKALNDGLGHLTGDQIIFETARRLDLAVSGKGFVARHGGDEFVCLVETSDRQALEIAESIQKSFKQPFVINEGLSQRLVTASIGVLHVTPVYKDHAAVIRDADLAMYRAKKHGRDCVVVFDDAMREEAIRRFDLESDLPTALAEKQITLMYQPIKSFTTDKIVGVETLIRWTHPKYGAIPPPEFVNIAEECGLIIPLGQYVLQSAVQDIQTWPITGISASINVSPIEFTDPDLVRRFKNATRGLEKGSIHIELTETTIVQNEKKASKIIGKLKELGIHSHLDDFGTGYSSVSHLVSLPLEGIKIDMSLIRKIHDPRYQETVSAIINLAHGLGMYCIVEGVETKSQYLTTKNLGADFVQGYFIARPMTSPQLSQWLLNQ